METTHILISLAVLICFDALNEYRLIKLRREFDRHRKESRLVMANLAADAVPRTVPQHRAGHKTMHRTRSVNYHAAKDGGK